MSNISTNLRSRSIVPSFKVALWLIVSLLGLPDDLLCHCGTDVPGGEQPRIHEQAAADATSRDGREAAGCTGALVRVSVVGYGRPISKHAEAEKSVQDAPGEDLRRSSLATIVQTFWYV